MRCLPLLLLALLLLPSPGVARAAEGPVETVRAFYQALDDGDCAKALTLRPGYAEARCLAITQATLSAGEVLCMGADTAALLVTVDYTSRGREQRFRGYVTLKKSAGGPWRIRNRSYHSEHKTSRERYLRSVAGLAPACSAELAPQPLPEGAKPPAATKAANPSLDALRKAASRELASLQQGRQRAAQPKAPETPERGQQPAKKTEPQKQPPPTTPPSAPAGPDTDADTPTPPAAVATPAEEAASEVPAAQPDVPESPAAAQPAGAEAQGPAAQETLAMGLARIRMPAGEAFYPPPQSFGSLAVLRAAFSPAALSGLSSDAAVTRLPEPDRMPPVRQQPSRVLAPVRSAYRGAIGSVSPAIEVKPVALTFDLAESADERSGYDADIVDFLRRFAVPATFYAGGKWMRSHEERAMQLMADPLFEVGNLAWSRDDLARLPAQRMRKQVLWAQGQYEELWLALRERADELKLPEEEINKIPAVPLTFRFPDNACSEAGLKAVAEFGLPVVQWDVAGTAAGQELTPRALAMQIQEKVRPGSIIACRADGHDRLAAEALPLFISWMREQGYHFVTASQLLQLGEPDAAQSCLGSEAGEKPVSEGE